MSKRTAKVLISDEALVLRQMRVRQGLSMRAAGKLVGISDSYVSQIENGRADFPTGSRLDQFLSVYGGIKRKSFYERVRNFRSSQSPRDKINMVIAKMTERRIKQALPILEAILVQ